MNCLSCHAPLSHRRRHAIYCSSTCRARASRAKRAGGIPSVDPGPKLAEMIERYRDHLLGKTPGTLRAFEGVAKALGPLQDRRVLEISSSNWESWIEGATANFSPSHRRQVRGYLLAMLRGTAHWLARGPGRPRVASHKGPALELTPEIQRALKSAPKERSRLIGHLVARGFYVSEIRRFRLADDGRVELPRPAWGRHAAPASIPTDLEARLQRYAVAKGIPAGAPLFPLTDQGIRLIVQRAVRRAGETQAPAGRLSSRLREALQYGPLPLSALAEASGAKPDTVYRVLLRMKDVAQLSGSKGRGHSSVWTLAAPISVHVRRLRRNAPASEYSTE